MTRLRYLLPLFFSLLVSPTWAADIAIVQTALNTGTGNQTFQSGESWTPVCALFFGTYGTVAGTQVNDSMFFMGGTDGTRDRGMSVAAEDTAGTSDTGAINSTTASVLTQLNTNQALDGSAVFVSWGAGNVTLNITDAPPAAYLMNIVLFGPGAVSNCYVGNNTTPSTVDTATDITDPNFAPDAVLVWSWSANTVSTRPTFGFATSDGTQRSVNWYNEDGQATSLIRSFTSSLYVTKTAPASGGAIELSTFDSQGFSAFLRVTNGTAYTFHYMALKLASGVTAKIVTSATPTSTGSNSITGAGFTPQFGLMGYSASQTIDVNETSGDAEVYGVSAFTAAQSASAAVMSDDATSSNTESVTDTKPVRVRKDAADFMTATFTAFNSDGAELNYSTVQAAARQNVVLFIQAAAASTILQSPPIPSAVLIQ